jgi:hypothetical protein
MIQTMLGINGRTYAQRSSHFAVRKMVGLAIVSSGFAVIAAQALQHAFGG